MQSITLNWEGDNNGRTFYLVQYKIESDRTWTTPIGGNPTTVLTYTINGLLSGTVYDFRISSFCNEIQGSIFTIDGCTDCPPITNLVLSFPDSTSAILNWDDDIFFQGEETTFYRVEFKLRSSNIWTIIVNRTTSLTQHITNLQGGELYDFRVTRLCNNVDSESVIVSGTPSVAFTWTPTDPFCVIGPMCPDGYSLFNDPVNGLVCQLDSINNNINTFAGAEQVPYQLLNTGEQGFNTRSRVINGALDGYSEPNIDDGINTYFPNIVNTDSCPKGIVTLNDFDYLVVEYSWDENSGRDLDTITGFVGTNTRWNGDPTGRANWVGYAQNNSSPVLPTGYEKENAYLVWSTDNTGATGPETVLIGFKNIIRDFPNIDNTIEVSLNAAWYNLLLNGDITISLKTYKGGTMSLSGYEFVNTGGVMVSDTTLNSNVNISTKTAIVTDFKNVARVTYNRLDNSAQIELL